MHVAFNTCPLSFRYASVMQVTHTLRKTLRDHDIDFHITPPPWNLFEKSMVDEEGGLHDRATATKSGDYVELSAERDLLLIFSACRSTIGDISNGKPAGAEIWLEEG